MKPRRKARLTSQCRLNLSRQTGGDLNLTGLLRVFKNYYPEIIVGDVTKGRAASFKVPFYLENKPLLLSTDPI